MDTEKILIIEDEKEIRDLIQLYLESNDYQVLLAGDGQEGLEIAENANPDLVILDILLPKKNGLEVCGQIRKKSNVPIIFLTCKQESEDIIEGLNLGGDDYLTKPFDPGVLIARVKALLRRSGSEEKRNIVIDELEIDLLSYTIRMRGQELPLSAKERQLLLFFAQHPNQVFSLEEIYQEIWGRESYGDTRTVMVHLSNIRKKMEADPTNPKYIQNIRGLGYMFPSNVS